MLIGAMPSTWALASSFFGRGVQKSKVKVTESVSSFCILVPCILEPIHRHSLGDVTSRRRGFEIGIECRLVNRAIDRQIKTKTLIGIESFSGASRLRIVCFGGESMTTSISRLVVLGKSVCIPSIRPMSVML